MNQKTVNMLNLQDALNTKVNPHWREAGNEWYRAIWMEAAEMLDGLYTNKNSRFVSE